MARHERDFRPTAEEPLGLDELRALLERQGEPATRKHAIACYLSASEGWQHLGGLLGGAFAEEGAGLRKRKGD